MTTIYALSSGRPPAAIGIIRISGPEAVAAGLALTGDLPPPRRAGLRCLSDPKTGETLDRALILAFPGPDSATGEDLVELHCHGGRAVIAAIEQCLSVMPGLRPADPGEFTRRALASGRIDLTEAEGLGDLLSAETESQRRAALQASEGRVARSVGQWAAALLTLSAMAEAQLDHADEDDVLVAADTFGLLAKGCRDLASAMEGVLDNPPVERLRDGLSIVLAGPPNVGKSTLLNRLIERNAAIVSPIAGTTRDRIEAEIVRAGVVYRLSDTAGLAAGDRDDPIEAIGIERTKQAMASADLILWLGDDAFDADDTVPVLWVHPRSDVAGREAAPSGRLALSAASGEGIGGLWQAIERRTSALLPRLDQLVLNQRQHRLAAAAAFALHDAADQHDLILMAEELRHARSALDTITGATGVEAMLDTLFSRFCIGK